MLPGSGSTFPEVDPGGSGSATLRIGIKGVNLTLGSCPGKKKMYNLDEEKIECAHGYKEFCFWQGKKADI